MAVVQSNGDGAATDSNCGLSLSVTQEVEPSENHKDNFVDEENTDGKIEPVNSIYHNEDKEAETVREPTKSESDNTEQATKKQVSFAVSIDKESSEVNHEIYSVENVEEKAVANSPDRRFLKFDVEIGRGSFKTVYKGLDTETGVAVAWCELQPNFPQDKKGRAEQSRFKEEAKMLKTLQHPNILRFYDSWEVAAKGSARPEGRPDRKILVLITELMTSGTLKGYLRRFKDVRPKIIRSWGRQILKGLNYLHTRSPPIIHRDLKCDNIFINGTTGMVKIGDLGLATLKRSHVKTVIGTPEFMAPEMYDEHYDESVDVYAFGMCLLEMTTLQYPYMECTNPGQIYKRVTQGKKPNAIEKVKEPMIKKIIEGCIEEAKENRYTVKDLLALPFFSELEGIEIKATPSNNDDEVRLVFQVPIKGNKGQNQLQQQQPAYETYERLFSLHSDQAQNIAQDMVKLNVIREAEVENITKSIQGKVDEVKSIQGKVNEVKKRTMSQLTDATSMTMPHNSISSDQDLTTVSSEIFKKPDYPAVTPIEEDKILSDTTLPSSVDVAVESDTNSTCKLPVNSTAEKLQQPPVVSDTASSSTKLTENGEKKNPPSPDTTAPTPLLPISNASQSNSPSHRLKEQSLHSRNSSSDLSQAGDSQVSMTKEPIPEPLPMGTGEVKKQRSRENEKVEEQPELPTVTRDTPQQENTKNTSDVQQQQQQPPQQPTSASSSSSQQQQQQKKARLKSTKEKRPLKLTIVGKDQDLVECNLTNGGQTITFKFSLDGDSSEQIAQGMVSANYLSENQKDEFKEYTEKMIKMARNNEMGVVGGSATSLHQADTKTTASVLQKEGDNKPVEPSKPPSVEKMDNGHKQPEKLESWHKQLEKSDSGNKLVEKMENGHKLLEKTESDSKLTSVGVDGVTKPLDPKATIGSQTSVDQESQYDQVDSPPLSPPSTTSVGLPLIDSVVNTQQTKSTVELEQCSTQDLCPTTEYQPYVSVVTTTTSQDVKITIDHTISTSTTSFTVPPVMSLSTPPTNTLSTSTVPTSASLPSTIEKKFTVELVSDESDDELMEEPVENFSTGNDVPCSQNQRVDTTITADAAILPVTNVDIGKTAGCSLRSDSSNSLYDEKVQRVPKMEAGRSAYQHNAPSPPFPGCPGGTERPSEKPTMDNLYMLSESFSVLMYSILQVLRNPAMESFINDLDSKYGASGPGPLLQEYNHDPEYQSLQIKLAEEERSLKEEHKRKIDEFIQRKRRSVTASPVGNHKIPSAGSTKARLKQPHNVSMNIPTTASAQLPYSSQPQAQHQYHQQQYHQHNHAGWPPEGETMERKVREALMSELTPKPKPSGKSEPSTKLYQRVDNSRVNPKNSVLQHSTQQGMLYQGSRGPPSVATWPGEDFHSGSNEMTPEPPNIPANSKLDISEFDPIETKNK